MPSVARPTPRRARPLAAAALPALLAACGAPTVRIDARSTMEAQVNGVGLSEDGSYGFAGMFQQTCDFDTKSGSVGKDYDAGPGLELVLDTFAGRGLLLLDGAVGELRQSGGDALEGRPLSGQGAVHGRILDEDAHLLLAETDLGCALERHAGGSAVESVALDAGACSLNAQLVVDRATATSYIGSRDGLLRVRDGAVERLHGGDAASLAHDPVADQLYAGAVGGGRVRALDRAGAPLWSAELDGALVGLAALPKVDAALAAVSVDGVLRLLALSAADGAVVGVTELDGVQASALVASADGAVAGLVSPDAVRFFDLTVADER